MKIGLITQYNYLNYGNRLQNWATQELLKKMGHDVITLAYAPSTFLRVFNIASKPCFFLSFRKRMKNFIDFTNESIKTEIIEGYSLKKLKSKFGERGTHPIDCAIIGSDQTWNPNYMPNPNINFARFVEKERRISYATSFGISNLPKKFHANFQRGLTEIENISVRETAGAKIVSELCGKDCPVLLDPTMMITKKEWAEFTKNATLKPKNKYIFCYFLTFNKNYNRFVKKIAKRHNLEIVSINRTGGKYFKASPRDFMSLIQNAELICTDSFHGHALSICLEKPFISFPSKSSMISRLQTILKLTDLESRNFQTINEKDIFQINYTERTPKIEKERLKAIKYLKNALTKIETR